MYIDLHIKELNNSVKKTDTSDMMNIKFIVSMISILLSTAIQAGIEEFNKKDLQITVIKNPGNNALQAKTGWGIFKSNSAINDQLVVVRVKGKIVRTFITSTANTKLGKETPDGIYLGAGECKKDKVSSIYDSEMDWAMMFCSPIGIHSTTENHYCELGKPASMGCIRLLRENARELYKVAHGEISIEGGKQDFIAKQQLGIRVTSGSSAINFWTTLSQDERNLILSQAAANRKKINAEIKKYNSKGDIIDDEVEDSKETPGAKSTHFKNR